ncbi:putative ABC transporter ATP-binding protein/permease [Cyphellophora attinorum]|uniref:Putative ABC transporter ATP-binding protein/permease n=1 Tax=Cyphellophora attinorum TaxID=1664694 RepID=A0A0N1HB50_9EURO|nr:putative ABC transporter ATP-binding protein/permease [Phialophora attinorum]KPI40246.1 putative ABC transporter ATP-binding protein/permease [Phialophora attinorum]
MDEKHLSPRDHEVVEHSGDQRAVVDISIRDLTIKVQPARPGPFQRKLKKDVEAQPSEKIILNDVSVDIPGGSLTVIMGSSGSGKTSLLNAMAKRVQGKALRQSGTIVCSKNDTARVEFSSGADAGLAYVMQQDALQPTLTVRETLRYAADLRLSSVMSKTDRLAKVESVITDLGLQDCADTKIGNSIRRGCSGGEKRRTSIGIQLLANQSVLTADEPTTGLDATSAMGVVRCLKNLADRGYCVVLTLHQPRSEIWNQVDNIILLARGSVVYSGPRSQCIQHFEEQGHKLPTLVNPFDFIIDSASIDLRAPDVEHASIARIERLQSAWKSIASSHLQPPPPGAGQLVPFNANTGSTAQAIRVWAYRILVHTRRDAVTTIRDRLGLFAAILEGILMGIAVGWIFFGLSSDLSGIRSRMGSFMACVVLQPYLILMFETYRMSIDIPIFDRELSEGVTSSATFILSRRLSRFWLEDVPISIIYATLFYWMAGFRSDPGQFFIFVALTLTMHLLSVTVALFCVAVERHFMIASIVANAMFLIQSYGAGFVINTSTIPIWLRWIKWITYSYYGFAAFCANEFAGHFYACPVSNNPNDPRCIEYTGTYILEGLDLPPDWLSTPALALLGFLALMLTVNVLILKYKTHNIQLVRVSTSDSAVIDGNVVQDRKDEIRPITVQVDAFELSVESNSLFRKKSTKTILHPTTSVFTPGTLNVIMGPSGSGKSSLLNAIANRLRNTTTTKYRRGGKVLMNGAVPSRQVVKSVISYVHQDDVGLLPALTVRETLRFAARLRLPARIPIEEKLRRAEDVLLKLGLKDCADTLIGDAFMKGISGGEKRRVSIAIQILTSPSILLLDEPTSGLDSFTAASILEVLQGLADEDRTIIFTIHQPRSDLYRQFGSMLLLAKGGHVVYSGAASDMVAYFDDLGHKCPEHANPADFTIDLVSTNWHERHSVSHEKLQNLIDKWTTVQQELATTDREVANPATLGQMLRERTPFRLAFPILMARNFKNIRRQPNILWGRINQFIACGVVFAIFFSPLTNGFSGVQTRAGFAGQYASIFFMGMLNSIATYPPERDIFYHEDDDAVYPLEAFFLQFTAIETPMEIIGALIFSILAVFPTGIHRTATMYFLSTFVAFSVASCGESLGIMFFSMVNHVGLAINVATVTMSLCINLAGIMAVDVTGFLQWINHVNPTKWVVMAMAGESLRGVRFTCDAEQRLPDGMCGIETGEQVLALYALDRYSVGQCVGFLAIIVIGLRGLAYVVLKARRMSWRK